MAPPTPLEGIYGAVTRQTLDGGHPDGWIPDERITVWDDIRITQMMVTIAGGKILVDRE